MEEVKITIIGAGVVGLAIAYELAKARTDVLVIEKYPSFGQETSSRNSEVIHAGLYYPEESLKALTCIEGRQLLYAFCRQYKIGHRQTGKLIIAMDHQETGDLEKLFKNGLANGVADLRLLTQREVEGMEPQIKAQGAIYSPSTGIVDSHALMKNLADEFSARGGQIAYNTELTAIEKNSRGFQLSTRDHSRGDEFIFLSKVLINAAGLSADRVAKMAGIEKEDYRLKYCKGDYFRVTPKKAKLISRLIYPVPKNDRAGLGIHATLDLAGGLRLGPDDEYVEKIGYDIAPLKQEAFFESTRVFLPFLQLEDLNPDTSGIRPKLQGPKEGFRDFLVKEETGNGLAGLINLIGIESPGLTSALALAKLVKKMVEKIL